MTTKLTRRCLAVLLMLLFMAAAGCSVDIPDDIYACADDRDCPADFFCWSSGFCNSVPESCAPRECFSGLCGDVDDGCGGTIDCGECGDGSTCAENLCVQDECEPVECAGLCGQVTNQCGNAANCACGIIEDCVEGLCLCERDTCESRGRRCGTIQTCGETVVCGICADGWECDEGQCVCEPTNSCAANPGFCGELETGCGTVVCGCPDGERCNAGMCEPGVCTPTPTELLCAAVACGTVFNGCEVIKCPELCEGDEICDVDLSDGIGERECRCPELPACGLLSCGVVENSCSSRDCGTCGVGTGTCEDHTCTCPDDTFDAPDNLIGRPKFMTLVGTLGTTTTFRNREAITRGDVDFVSLPRTVARFGARYVISTRIEAPIALTVRALLTCPARADGPNALDTDCEGAFLPSGSFECAQPNFEASCEFGAPAVDYRVSEPSGSLCTEYELNVDRQIPVSR